MLNNQQIFDKVAKHLLAQSEQSLGERKLSCRYKSAEGLECAVGCLIHENAYTPGMENRSVFTLFDSHPYVMKSCGLGIRNRRLLGRLQAVHDDITPAIWHDELRAVARFFGLNMRALKAGA